MANNNTLVLELEEKIKAVEERLAQIAGYKFIPPSIQQEKADLEKRKTVLFETKKHLEGGGQSDSNFRPAVPGDSPRAAEGTVPTAFQAQPPITESASDGLDIGYNDKNIIRFAQKEDTKLDQPHAAASAVDGDEKQNDRGITEALDTLKAEDEEKGDSNNDMIGESYSITADTPDGGVKSIDLPEEKEGTKSSLKELMKTEDSGDTGDLLVRVVEVVGLLHGVLDYSDHHPDKEYLVGVLQNFESTVKSLKERVDKAKMPDRLKLRAVKGRVALYLEEIKSEFSFSQLLDDKIEEKIEAIVK